MTSLKDALRQFTRMYRPHEAREDTVLFPSLRTVVSKHEFDALGEDFEKKEHQLFGEDGFERMVERVAGIERTLGIYDLAQFTPREPASGCVDSWVTTAPRATTVIRLLWRPSSRPRAFKVLFPMQLGAACFARIGIPAM